MANATSTPHNSCIFEPDSTADAHLRKSKRGPSGNNTITHVERPPQGGPAVPTVSVGAVESHFVSPAVSHVDNGVQSCNPSRHADGRQFRRLIKAPLSVSLMRRRRRHKRCPTTSICNKNDMQVSHVHSQPCHFARPPHVPQGPASSSKKDRFVFNNTLSADTDKVHDRDRQQFPRVLPVVDAVGHKALRTRLEDQPLDPGKLQQIEANLSLRHRLVLAQPRLNRAHLLRPQMQLVGPEIKPINTNDRKT